MSGTSIRTGTDPAREDQSEVPPRGYTVPHIISQGSMPQEILKGLQVKVSSFESYLVQYSLCFDMEIVTGCFIQDHALTRLLHVETTLETCVLY